MFFLGDSLSVIETGARLIGSWLSWVCNQLTRSRSLRVVISSSTWARKKNKKHLQEVSLRDDEYLWIVSDWVFPRSQIQQPPNQPITPGRHRQLGTRQLLELQSAFPEFVSFLGWLLKTWEKFYAEIIGTRQPEKKRQVTSWGLDLSTPLCSIELRWLTTHTLPRPNWVAPGTWTTRSSITTCGTSTISSELLGFAIRIQSLFRENDYPLVN